MDHRDQRCQKPGFSITKTVKISNLPSNIQKQTNHLTNDGICPQLSEGPTSPNAGPIFPMAEAAADKDVTKSNPVEDIIKAVIIKINI